MTYLQNHDQVGNRAKGERVGHLATDAAVAVATGLLCCSPFVPLCFQGEEWAAGSPFQYFCDHEDPDLAAAVSEGRRHEFAAFGWGPEDVPDPGELSTFLRSRLDWSELGRPGHAEAIGWWRRLIDLRRRCAWLSDGSLDGLEARADEEAGLLLVRRGPGLVAANFGDRPALAAVPRGSVLLVSSVEGVRLSGEEMSLPAVSFAVAGPPLQASGCC